MNKNKLIKYKKAVTPFIIGLFYLAIIVIVIVLAIRFAKSINVTGLAR